MSLVERVEQVRGWAKALGLPLHPDFPEFVDEGHCLSVDVEQGSPEWALLRCGLPTTSALNRIITETRLEYSKSAHPYIAELRVETRFGLPKNWGETDWTVRGHKLEPKARRWYESERTLMVRQVGFLMSKDGSEGGSPDGLVGDDGLVEIKCFGADKHERCLMGLEEVVTKSQAQGLLRITGRSWVDMLAYHEASQPRLYRVERDEDFIGALDEHMRTFKADRAKIDKRMAMIGTARIDDSLEKAELRAELEASLDAEKVVDGMYGQLEAL